MGKKKKNKLKKQFKSLFKGNTFSGNMISNILAAMLMEWWEERQQKKKTARLERVETA